MGHIVIPAGYTGYIALDGLTFYPFLIAFRAAAEPGTGFMDASLGLYSYHGSAGSGFSLDVAHRDALDAGNSYQRTIDGRDWSIRWDGPPYLVCSGIVYSRQPTGFTIQVLSNTLTTDALLAWFAASSDVC